jgi:hypothetical protein
MNFDLRVRAGKNRHLVATVALFAWALGAAACSGGGGGGGTGGKATGGSTGAGGKATGGTGAGGSGAGGVTGVGGSIPDAGPGDVPANNDATTDSSIDVPLLPCIPDGGDASGDCCPNDPLKTQPGICGCGVADDDTDGDGTPDCHDACPNDPAKTVVGICGCYFADTDTDLDGTPDCNDGCPKDPARTVPGLCGCGLPNSAAPLCLAHRYSFNDGTPSSDAGAGDASASDAGSDASGGGTTTVRDSVGTANGTAMNVVLRGTGSLTLAGGQTDQYVALPSGIISALGNSATFEAWINWTGAGGAWQRIFDFGAADPTMPGVQGSGTTFVFLSPLSGAGVTLFSVNTFGLTEVMAPTFFPQGLTAQGQPHHLAAVIDAGTSGGDAGAPSASLYIDGTLIGSTPLTSSLSQLLDLNNWLGRSQFTADPEFGGTYYEFRIHSTAMTQAQINASIAAGPDNLP